MPVKSVVVYQRVWIDGLNRGDVSPADTAFAPDCVFHLTSVADPIRGVGAWKEVIGGFLRAFPDIQFTMEDRVVQEDRIAFRWHATATRTGPLGAAPPKQLGFA
jgi:predicted ester cyclase